MYLVYTQYNKHIPLSRKFRNKFQKPEFKDKIRLVITSSNKDDEELLKLIPNKEEKTKIATEFKKDNSKIKIVIVVDM